MDKTVHITKHVKYLEDTIKTLQNRVEGYRKQLDTVKPKQQVIPLEMRMALSAEAIAREIKLIRQSLVSTTPKKVKDKQVWKGSTKESL